MLVDDLLPAQKPGAGVALVGEGMERAPALRGKLLCERLGETLVGTAVPHVNIHDLTFVKAEAPWPPFHANFLRRGLETSTLALSE